MALLAGCAVDCANHDFCVRFGHDIASFWCDDEFTSTIDRASAPNCGAWRRAVVGLPASEPASDRGDPLHDYFERADCPALAAAVAEPAASSLAEQGCTRVFAEFEEHDASLVGVDAAAPDGRDASLYLVRATLREGEQTRSIVVGVRWVGERWRVVRM